MIPIPEDPKRNAMQVRGLASIPSSERRTRVHLEFWLGLVVVEGLKVEVGLGRAISERES